MQEVLGSRLGGVTTFGVRSLGTCACQGRDSKGGMALCSLVWDWEAMAKWGCGDAACDVLLMRTGLFGEECKCQALRLNVQTFSLMVMMLDSNARGSGFKTRWRYNSSSKSGERGAVPRLPHPLWMSPCIKDRQQSKGAILWCSL